jgi:hypothetical protein
VSPSSLDNHPLLSGKSVSRSVSLPELLWPVLDAHAESLGGDRSSWIYSLVVPALRAAGKLGKGTPTPAQARLQELLRQFPEEMVLEHLDSLAATAAAEAAKKAVAS